MTIDIEELIDPALDWAVAKCEGEDVVFDRLVRVLRFPPAQFSDEGWYKPSEDWAQGGPIIERMMKNHFFFMENDGENIHVALSVTAHDNFHGYGPTPLIAAMRCYVASRLGEVVNIPEELLL